MNLLDNWIHEPYDNSVQHPYFRTEETVILEIYKCCCVYCVTGGRVLRDLNFRVNITAVWIQKLPGSAFLPETASSIFPCFSQAYKAQCEIAVSLLSLVLPRNYFLSSPTKIV